MLNFVFKKILICPLRFSCKLLFDYVSIRDGTIMTKRLVRGGSPCQVLKLIHWFEALSKHRQTFDSLPQWKCWNACYFQWSMRVLNVLKRVLRTNRQTSTSSTCMVMVGLCTVADRCGGQTTTWG